jgi:hypothetical protein
VAIRAFEAARGTVTHSTVQLRNKARIMRTERTGGYNSATGKVDQP